jgi:ABC-2 type transport system permease protein
MAITNHAFVRPRPGVLPLLAGQVRYHLRLARRSPMAAFATVVIPVMVLLAVGLLYSGGRIHSRENIRYIQFFTPAMVAFATITACYMGVISSTVLAREQGILKRIRSTPLPSWVYLTGRVLAAGIVALLSSVLVVGVGAGVYGFHMIWSALPDALLVLAVGIFCFCSLGLAVTVIVPSAEAALPIAWGTMLPICLVSDVFQPIDGAPAWLRSVAAVFPPRRLADQLESLFNPARHVALTGADLAVLGTWVGGAALFALIAFRWEPSVHGRGLGETVRAVATLVRDRIADLLAAAAAAAARRRPPARPPSSTA